MTTAIPASSDPPAEAQNAPARALSTRTRPPVSASGPPPQRASSTSNHSHHRHHHSRSSQQNQQHHRRSHSRQSSSTAAAAASASASPAQATPSRPVQDHLPKHDFETTNVVSYSKDHSPTTNRVSDSSRPQHHRSTRSNHRPNQTSKEMPANTAVANNAGPAPVAPGAADPRSPTTASASASKHSRSRTTIPTPSGKWILGKTVGAGSMGKVKLARKEDTGEQVCHLS